MRVRRCVMVGFFGVDWIAASRCPGLGSSKMVGVGSVDFMSWDCNDVVERDGDGVGPE